MWTAMLYYVKVARNCTKRKKREKNCDFNSIKYFIPLRVPLIFIITKLYVYF